MIKIWNLVIQDSHFDVVVDSYIDRDIAIREAKNYLTSVAESHWEEWTGNPKAFEFFAHYGDSNSVRVIAGDLYGEVSHVAQV